MSGLTQYEMGLVFVIAGLLLIVARHWRKLLMLIVIGAMINSFFKKDDR